MQTKIVVVGSINTDLVIQVHEFPKSGETTRGIDHHVLRGGKGANQAVAAARLEGEVVFYGRVGDDAYGREAMAALELEGIDIKGVGIDSDKLTGLAQVMVNDRGENMIAVSSGANERLGVEAISGIEKDLEGAGILLLQLETPLESARWAMKKMKACSGIVILNPAPVCQLPDGVFELVDVMTPNETEAHLLTGIRVVDDESANQAANVLHGKGVGTVIITLGGRGCYLSCDGFSGRISANRALVVDTTAAGDTFNGALAVALCAGRPMKDAVRFANAAAALSVEKRGAQSSMPRRTEVDRMVISSRI